ncbi:serine protease inhibitor [Kitasatospora sp. SolWspMP-SS2h]|nr:serpin family protein [Kitasatospora sp. SolWspMP-SS2h]RAJ31959.1 serine protease inhibitor [Kitasatospora sp. SolWspMP-SS2h]
MVVAGAVERVNALGACWGRELEPGSGAGQVWTALGVWPLLAVLAPGADGPARAELERALGVPAGQAPAAARELLARVAEVPGCAAALGLWTAPGVEVEPEWAAGPGAGLWRRLTGDPAADRAALDAWAADRTGGLVRRMPVEPADAPLVLASALTVRTGWAEPFREDRGRAAEGPWAGRPFRRLSVSSPGLYGRIAVAESAAAGRVTEVRVAGGGEVDVHLVLGAPRAVPGAVVSAGFELVAGAVGRTPVAGLADGEPWPGLALESVRASVPGDVGALETVAFEVRAEQDLLAHAGLFGLRTAAGDGSHFPGISRSVPLRVGQARQAAVAEFGAEGFEAGAVTAVAMTRSGIGAPPGLRVRRATARYDRPFAFLAVHRPSGLVLVAGWVAEPTGAAG